MKIGGNKCMIAKYEISVNIRISGLIATKKSLGIKRQ